MHCDRRRLVGGLVGSLFALTGWSQSANKSEKGSIGISLPTITSLRWVIEGLAMTRSLDKLGYRAILQYANDDIPTQTAQINDMLANGVTVLVISAIDGTQLAPVLLQPKAHLAHRVGLQNLQQAGAAVGPVQLE